MNKLFTEVVNERHGLGPQALGALAVLYIDQNVSQCLDPVPIPAQIQKHFKIGRARTKAIVDELRSAGYLELERREGIARRLVLSDRMHEPTTSAQAGE